MDCMYACCVNCARYLYKKKTKQTLAPIRCAFHNRVVFTLGQCIEVTVQVFLTNKLNSLRIETDLNLNGSNWLVQ